jgi:hypothetical protein
MKSLRIVRRIICVLVVFASPTAFAGEHEFRGVVQSIEKTYGVHHTHIPLLGAMLFFARPAGVGGVKLAVFENFEMPADAADFSRVVEASLGPDWHPFVRVRSRSDGETTLIYTSPAGGKMRMMIVNLEPSEATVVEMSLSDRAIKHWLKEPGEEADGQSGHHRRHDDD